MGDYRIWCAIQNEWNAFPVDIKATSIVGDLKDAIKVETMPTFHSIDAYTLTLYRVDAPASTREQMDKALRSANLGEELDALASLDKLYPLPPPPETVHILVVPPAPGE